MSLFILLNVIAESLYDIPNIVESVKREGEISPVDEYFICYYVSRGDPYWSVYKQFVHKYESGSIHAKINEMQDKTFQECSAIIINFHLSQKDRTQELLKDRINHFRGELKQLHQSTVSIKGDYDTIIIPIFQAVLFSEKVKSFKGENFGGVHFI